MLKITILGAGVAGVCTAIALKLRGFDVCIYERHSEPSNIGAGIVLWPNAAYVLDQLGVLDDIRSVSGLPTKMQRLSSVGEDLGAIDIKALSQHMGYPSLSIIRSEFQNIMLAKLHSLGATIHYNHRVTNIKTNSSSEAEVQFQNDSKITADLVIGADGRMASQARHYVIGNNKPIYQGFINWIGVFESSQNLFPELEIQDFWGIGERFGIVPITKNKAYWAGGITASKITNDTTVDYKQELMPIFEHWSATIQKIINESPLSLMNKIYVHDHDPISNWYKNNLVIIGDAAHAPLPTSGQGACQAVEDAWCLAKCLEDKPDSIQAALTKFTSLRYEKTTNIISAGRGLASSLFTKDEQFCLQRNENSKKTNYDELAMSMAKIWGQGLPLHIDHRSSMS